MEAAAPLYAVRHLFFFVKGGSTLIVDSSQQSWHIEVFHRHSEWTVIPCVQLPPAPLSIHKT